MVRQLRGRAQEQITRGVEEVGGGLEGVAGVYGGADAAFGALEEVLGGREWFGGGTGDGDTGEEGGGPGVLDAHVFSYTYVLVGAGLEWRDTRLGDLLRGREGLMRHMRRVAREYFGVEPT